LRKYIKHVEKLLINSHFPAYNSQGVSGIPPFNVEEDKVKFEYHLLILNWDDRGRLLAEVSTFRYTDYYANQ
jgi:hypothetical protein